MSNNFLRCCDILTYAALYFFVYLLLVLVGSFPAQLIPGLQGWLNAIAMTGAFCAVVLLLKEKKKLVQMPRKPWMTAGCVVLLALGTCIGLNVLMGLIPWEEMDGVHVAQDNASLFGIPFYVRIISYVVVAPLAEEILFREVIFAKARVFMPVWLAVVISAAAFGLYHGNLQQGIYAFLCGCIMAFVYAVTDSFAMPVLFHATANLAVNLSYEYEAVRTVIYSLPSRILMPAMAVLGAILLIYITKNKNYREKSEQMF